VQGPARAIRDALQIATVCALRAEAFLHACRTDPRPELVAREWPASPAGDIAERWTDQVLERWNRSHQLIRREAGSAA
jgi:hypothetical protein